MKKKEYDIIKIIREHEDRTLKYHRQFWDNAKQLKQRLEQSREMFKKDIEEQVYRTRW